MLNKGILVHSCIVAPVCTIRINATPSDEVFCVFLNELRGEAECLLCRRLLQIATALPLCEVKLSCRHTPGQVSMIQPTPTAAVATRPILRVAALEVGRGVDDRFATITHFVPTILMSNPTVSLCLQHHALAAGSELVS